ncbi:gp53-like domain-containing protein [Escherichia coli]
MLRIGQVEATATQDGKYTDGSVAGGIAATRLRAAAFNAMQEELAHIVESAGLALDINDMTQVLKAIQKLTLSRANPFADIKSDGAAAISTALTNLGIKSAALCDVGAGTNQIPDMGSFGILKNAIGYQYLPGGLILQWGKVGPTNAGQTTNVTFTITHPTATVAVMCTLDATALPAKGFGCSAIGVARTGFGFHVTHDSAFNSNSGGFWFALGY